MERGLRKGPRRASALTLGTRVHVSEAIEEALDLRLAEAETHAERIDGLCGPISDAAKPYSEAIDQIEADRQALLAEGDVG